MKFISILVKEGRKEDLKKKYSSKFDDEVLNFVLGISDLQDFNHKYTDFILKALDPNSDIDMNVDIAVGLVKDFNKYQSQLIKKDINQYNSFTELETALKPFIEKEKEKELEKQADRIYENDKFLVIKPKTEEASCKYGYNTKWCVSSHSSGHFGRYTQGNQALYFIINKDNSTNRTYSKIAIHFDNEGHTRYYDSQDVPMNQREIDVMNYAFPEIIDAINKDYEIIRTSGTSKLLISVFNSMGYTSVDIKNYLQSTYTLSVFVRGFENIPNFDFGRSGGMVTVSLIDSKSTNRFFDEYQMFIKYDTKDTKSFTASIGFMSDDNTPYHVDLGLEEWGIDSTYIIQNTISQMAEGIRKHIGSRILTHVQNNPKLVRKASGTETSKVWNKPNSGYTFGKNKGMIKKMVDYLDAGYDNGTKLDFLEYIGTLKSRVVDGKKEYARPGSSEFSAASRWDGQYSSFFSAAVLAGIIQYKREGRRFIIIPGPNFESFKNGELRAL